VAHALTENHHALGVVLVNKELELRLLLAIEPRTPKILTAAIFGETAAALAEMPDAQCTSIENRFGEQFARTVAGVFEAVCVAGPAGAFELEELLPITDAEQMGWRDMPAVEARFQVMTSAGACSFKALAPQSVLHALRETLMHDASLPTGRDPHWSQQISA